MRITGRGLSAILFMTADTCRLVRSPADDTQRRRLLPATRHAGGNEGEPTAGSALLLQSPAQWTARLLNFKKDGREEVTHRAHQ